MSGCFKDAHSIEEMQKNYQYQQKQQLILFHYPIVEWARLHHGSIHLHGHQHNASDYNISNANLGLLRYDVGVDANNMTPISITEIFSFFSISLSS